MGLCRKRKILFVHIPKTGGNSVAHYFKFKQNNSNFFGRSKVKKIYENSTAKILAGHEYSHYTLRLLKKHIDIKKYFIFSFVRNPFDKLVSEFFWRIKYKLSFYPFFEIELKPSNFELFLNKLQEVNLTFKENKIIWESHLYPQTKFLFLKRKNKKNKLEIDFLGRFENFSEDMKKLSSMLEIEGSPIFKNATEHEPYKNYYNKSSKKIVETLYADDLNNFNYIF